MASKSLHSMLHVISLVRKGCVGIVYYQVAFVFATSCTMGCQLGHTLLTAAAIYICACLQSLHSAHVLS